MEASRADATPAGASGPADADSRAWLEALGASGERRDEAVARLHALLVRAARFELSRRRAQLAHVRGEVLEDVAQQAADDALVAILRKLSDYRGDSRFTTWAIKFALLEAAVRVRRRAWQGREIPVEDEGLSRLARIAASPQVQLEQVELLDAISTGVREALTPHQRRVLVALALNGVPIDVLAERLNTNRNALYKTLHDARRRLRAHLLAAGLGDRE